jgi:hypothetical protein
MFTDINSNDYIRKFELQHSEFLRDVLWPEIEFQLRDVGSNKDIIIYKINSPGIKEEISMDEFIYYMHYDVVVCIRQKWEDHKISEKCNEDKLNGPRDSWGNRSRKYYPPDNILLEVQESKQKIQQNNETIRRFEGLFTSIQSIRNAVENMKILLTYEPSEEEEEESEEEEVQEEESDTSNSIKEVSTKRFESP